MILCAGEALIDMLPRKTEDGEAAFAPYPGGRSSTPPIALARLETPVSFFTGLSDDLFGDRLAKVLTANGVDQSLIARSDRPTTLAFVDADGRQCELRLLRREHRRAHGVRGRPARSPTPARRLLRWHLAGGRTLRRGLHRAGRPHVRPAGSSCSTPTSAPASSPTRPLPRPDGPASVAGRCGQGLRRGSRVAHGRRRSGALAEAMRARGPALVLVTRAPRA
jgi:hypothetical protein